LRLGVHDNDPGSLFRHSARVFGSYPVEVRLHPLRIENGLLAEHWDVIQDEATREASKSGLPMFEEKFHETEANIVEATSQILTWGRVANGMRGQ
jgi:hypothetical protein